MSLERGSERAREIWEWKRPGQCTTKGKLLVRESDDRIEAGGAKGRINGPDRSAREGEESCGANPLRSNEHRRPGIGLLHNGLDGESQSDSQKASETSENDGLAEKHAHDAEASKAERFEDANFAGALHDHGVDVEEHDEKTNDDSQADHRARKWFQLRKIRGTHETHILGDGEHAVLRTEAENLSTSGFDVAFAANVEHGNALFGDSNFLSGLERNEITGAFAVSDNSADGKGMIQKRDGVTDLEMLGLRDDVIGDDFIGGIEGAAGAEEEAAAESVKALVVNAVDDDEIFGFSEAESGSDFVDAGKRGNFVSQRFLHDGTREGEENRGVRRLNENIGADTFLALSPFGNHAGGKANDEQNENNLNGDGNDSEKTSERTGNDIAPEHLKQRKSSVE